MKHAFVITFLSVISAIGVLAQEKFLLVGNGGGFSGAATVYKISDNGKVWKGKGLAEVEFTECSKIKKKQARKFFSDAVVVSAAGPLSHPGNLYYFISISENGKDTRITWGDSAYEPPGSIKKLYQDIHTSVSNLSYKPVK